MKSALIYYSLIPLCALLSIAQGEPVNEKDLNQWHIDAAAGDITAQHDLGLAYHIGEGTPQDNAKAIKWFLKAANQGHHQSQNTLGRLYQMG